MSDLNGRSYNVQVTEVSLVDDKVQQMPMNPKVFVPFQVGMELAQFLLINELALSTLTEGLWQIKCVIWPRQALTAFSTFFGLKLSHLIFSAIKQLPISLQGKNTSMQEAVFAADLAIKFLLW